MKLSNKNLLGPPYFNSSKMGSEERYAKLAHDVEKNHENKNFQEN